MRSPIDTDPQVPEAMPDADAAEPERVATVEEDVVPEPVTCAFCAAPAEFACPRCAAPYCELHGGDTCDRCSAPASGLPSPWVVRSALAVFAAGALLALWLIIRPPRLPGERAPAQGAVPTPAATVAGGAAGPSPGAVAGATATPTALTPVPTPAGERYQIKPGDTLNRIAAQYGVTVEAIRAANPGLSESALQIGQEIVIPARR